MADKLADAEHPQLCEGTVEHRHAGIAREPRREQESVRLRHAGMDSRRQGAARRMIAVVGHRARGADAHRPVAPQVDRGDRSGRDYPPRRRQGFAVLFTGLSGDGKSTFADALAAMLRQTGDRPVPVLDGDAVRRRLSSDFGFSLGDRETALHRIGFIAAAVVRDGGIALCAAIAPCAASRRELRDTVETAGGGFLKVHVSTPLATCEARDPKGLYASARAGLIEGFTGIDDPYEPPDRPDIAIDAIHVRPGPPGPAPLPLNHGAGPRHPASRSLRLARMPGSAWRSRSSRQAAQRLERAEKSSRRRRTPDPALDAGLERPQAPPCARCKRCHAPAANRPRRSRTR